MTTQPATAHVASTQGEQPPGSSAEQRAAERVMLDLLGQDLGFPLEPTRITMPSGAVVELDGTDLRRTVLVECWAHQGTPDPVQRQEVVAAALKLTWVAATLYPRPRPILCLSDPAAAAPFLPGSRFWAAQAIRDLHIEIRLVELPTHLRHPLYTAQSRPTPA